MKVLTNATVNFLAHCRYEKGLSEKTLEAYQIDLKQFSEFVLKEQLKNDLAALDKTILRKYLEVISHFKPKTIKRKVATLKAFFTFLEFDDIIVVNPFRKMRVRIKEPKELPTQLTQSEITKLLKVVYRAKEKVDLPESYSYQARVRDVAVVELLFATGIRVSELCSLKSEHVDLKTGFIKVDGKGSKQRVIPVYHAEVKLALKEYARLFAPAIRKTGNFFINRIGNPLSDQSVRFMVRDYAQKARINKAVTPHTFRHTFATLLLEENVDIKYIQQFLGHSSIMTTQIYTHVNKTQQRRILSAKHPRKKISLG